MIKIRSNLNSSIEFSVKKKVGNISEILTVKIERSNVKGKPEFLNEITEEECKALKDDSSGVFKTLLKEGKFQIIQDEDVQEDSENRAFSMEELEDYASKELEAYKKGDGADLLQSSLDDAKDVLELEFTGRLQEALDNQKTELGKSFDGDFKKGLADQKEILDSAAKTKMDADIKEARAALIKKHNIEVANGKLKKWS